ncbi:hypothetical protein [Algiphilus sp.]|uniref:hypothetical protein n=1 Tax=Algiphilus sp. TaxID=1872431 RepID=UPI0032EF560B
MKHAASTHSSSPRQEATVRSLAALPLAWLAATLSTAGLTSVLVAGGLPRAETTVWLMLTGLLLWLALAIYAVAARWLLRAWLVPTVLATLGALLIWQFDAGGAL